jgi:ABC-type lipoprotein export system ATPase subunit
VADALSIGDLRFRFAGAPETAPTVSVASLSLAAGEQMLLTGSSGCGKSTLLNLVSGILTADAGSIRVAGTDIQALHGAARDRFRGAHIGMVFQTFNLLQGFSAIENVMLAMMFSQVPPREHRARAASLLDHLGLTTHQHNRAAERLSVGQQQRVAVARALACTPALVLADEPTASLDPGNAAAAVNLLQTACRSAGAALLCVSHDPALPAQFSRHVSMREISATTAEPLAHAAAREAR